MSETLSLKQVQLKFKLIIIIFFKRNYFSLI